VKKKQPVHPRLYTDLIINSSIITFKYLSNDLNHRNQRIVKYETENLIKYSCYNSDILIKKNKDEYIKLEKYIKIQKKALEKHQKARNYDSCKIVKSSILFMNEFKLEFNRWFDKNMILK